MVGKHGEQQVQVSAPFNQICLAQMKGDWLQSCFAEDGCAFQDVAVAGAAIDAFWPSLCLKAGMKLAGIVKKGENGKSRNDDRRQRSTRNVLQMRAKSG